MFFIENKNPLKLFYFSTATKKEIISLQQKYATPKLGQELFWEYKRLAFDGSQFPTDKSDEVIWQKLTKTQKTIFALSIFISQVNNGGIWQFFFNHPEYIAAVGMALHIVKPYSITFSNYEKVYKECLEFAKTGEYEAIKERFSDETLSWEERWSAFKSGENHLPSQTLFNENFFDEKNQEYFYQEINTYIKQNLDKLLKVETDDAPHILSKKEAVPHFTDYLTEVYGETPTEVTVYYSANVSIDTLATTLFLMKFTMSNGYESIGITGHFSYHFPDVPFLEIKEMHQKFHKQRLVNIFYGAYLVREELKMNPDANVVNQEKWEELLARLQDENNSQVPVNVEFKEYFKLGKEEFYIYSGDLLYNEDKSNFPTDINKVEMARFNEKKKTAHKGETDLIFHTSPSPKPSFGRCSKLNPVMGKYVLFGVLGKKHKLLKDNPWGF